MSTSLDANSMSQQILASATRFFAAQGFEGTSLQDIASDVGIRKASLLYHFPSKEILRQAVLDGLIKRWNDVLPRLLLLVHNTEEQFDAIASEAVKFFASDTERARLLMREFLDRPAEISALIGEHVEPWLGVIDKQLSKAKAKGKVASDVDPAAYLVCMISLILSVFTSARAISSGVSQKRLVAEVKRVAKASLLNIPPTKARSSNGKFLQR